MSLCKDCQNRMDTWSEKLRKEYNGCSLLLQEETQALAEHCLASKIRAQRIGFGWVTNGRMSFNKQIITKDVSGCDYYIRARNRLQTETK